MAVLDLTTKEDVRAFKEWKSTKDPDDAWLESAITAISKRVADCLGRAVLEEAQEEIIDVYNGEEQRYALHAYPILASPAPVVSHDTIRVFGTGSVVNAAHYTIDEERGILVVDQITLDSGIRVLKLEYTAGMATSTADFKTKFPDIAEAVVMQVAFWYESRKRLGQRSITDPDGTISLENPMKLLPGLEELIDLNRRRFIW